MTMREHPHMGDYEDDLRRAKVEFNQAWIRLSNFRRGLICIGCGATSDLGVGWKAYLTADGGTAVYCPDCAEFEFGTN